ncbi:MAG: Mut7-C RNAse domain-containing protein [Pseudomonadota bacterium]|nr:Mut7-C RNAse domain-containing protein [Gammaproteobacteria bacterium]MBU1732682.1 Mut7-C RNAse domain-containing protein [Gammaproteobacteria bacterium]MBU1891507.1 Mut7-C RNAse domain-containing protein [Gammaproteobacteria bacterium]
MVTKFLCDAMLARFARYLRAAGYDTALAGNAVADREVLRQAVDEGRWLLTADRKIIEHKAAQGRVVMLPHGSLDAQAKVLDMHFKMDWTGQAFSRCLLDNALLIPVSEPDMQGVPLDVQQSGETVLQCPTCRRVYWRGSHYRRMMGRLRNWQED